MGAHGRQVQAAIAAFGGAVVAALQVQVGIELFVALFRGCPCFVFFFPFHGISRGDTEESGVEGEGYPLSDCFRGIFGKVLYKVKKDDA